MTMSLRGPIRTLLAVVGGCVVVSVVVPPLSSLLDAGASLALLGIVGVAAIRAVIWVDRLGRATRRVASTSRSRADPSPPAGRARGRTGPDRAPQPGPPAAPRHTTDRDPGATTDRRRASRRSPSPGPDQERLARGPGFDRTAAAVSRRSDRGGPVRA
ncbi:MAG TPA: hypothetical protein VNN74_10455 [Candidatus Micrarchaeia archaeon]|nr:hypothetical protein [Candidatus Micrarchaeia archaeon]